MIKIFTLALILAIALAAVPQFPVIGVYTQIDEYD